MPYTNPGGGNVVGPALSTNNAVALYSGVTGKLLINSVTIINPTTGAISGFTTGTGLTLHGGGTITGASGAVTVGGPINISGILTSKPVGTDSDGFFVVDKTGGGTDRIAMYFKNATATKGRMGFELATTGIFLNNEMTFRSEAGIMFTADGGTTASLRLAASTNIATFAAAVVLTSKITTYNNIATAGWGVPAIQAAGSADAQVARSAALASYTVGAADGVFEVGGNVLVTTSTTHSFSLDVSYTDESNTPRVLILPVAQLAGAFVAGGLITNITGAGPYESTTMVIRCKAATSIIIRPSAGTFTTVVYDAAAHIKQVS